ncbi:MAG: DUF2490 domain-containing protein [Bacteroidota bacterium]
MQQNGISQERNTITWNGLQLSVPIAEKFTFNFKPIIRFKHNDEFDLVNWSLDYQLNYKLSKAWTAGVLGRTWFLPNGNIRQFAWLDFVYSTKLSNQFKFKTLFRLHGAFDVEERFDGDFIRVEPSIHYTGIKDFEPFIGYANFFQLNKLNYIQRARYKLGFNYKFSPKLSLNFQYWNEAFYNPEFVYDHVFVTTLKYSLPRKNRQ